MREAKSIFQRKHLELLSEESLLEEGAWSGEQGGEEGVREEGREGQGEGSREESPGAVGRSHTHAALGSKLSLQRDICSITPMHCG